MSIGRRTSKCKGPKTRRHLDLLKNMKETSRQQVLARELGTTEDTLPDLGDLDFNQPHDVKLFPVLVHRIR